uniref:Uncharacterized protein n=1 Tax=Rhizophora mucronata TaxID=61149 RepID=A0A2P2NP11_RHIMU
MRRSLPHHSFLASDHGIDQFVLIVKLLCHCHPRRNHIFF